jgi:hypothetical protein
MVPLIALTVTAMVPMIDPYSCATNPAIARQAAVGPISTLFYWCSRTLLYLCMQDLQGQFLLFNVYRLWDGSAGP